MPADVCLIYQRLIGLYDFGSSNGLLPTLGIKINITLTSVKACVKVIMWTNAWLPPNSLPMYCSSMSSPLCRIA